MKACKQCQQEKPSSDYLSFADKSVKVRFCNSCARTNMSRYWKMRASVTDPAKIARDARD